MDPKGLLASLFDMSFSSFITTRIIKLIFALGILCSAVWAIAVIVMGFTQGGAFAGVLMLLLSPIFFLLAVLGARMYCEMVIVAFRIAENTTRLVELAEGPSAEPAAEPAAETPPPASEPQE